VAGPASNRLEILNARTTLRHRLACKTPVVVTAAGEIKVAMEGKVPQPMNAYEDAPPPAGWAAPEYDDAGWSRDPAPVEVPPWREGAALIANSGYLLCVRGKFLVADPAAVRNMKVSVEYVGGAAVYVNGKEIARGHLPPGALKPDATSEKYPDDVFLDDEGFLTSDKKKEGERLAGRVRKLMDVAIPPGTLRKGLNVVAVELRRSPVSEALLTAKRRPKSNDCVLAHLGLARLEVTAAPGSAATPNVGVPAAARVWTCGPYDTVFANDAGDVQEPPLPLTLVAARNGTFSGRVAVSSPEAIRKMRVAATELKPVSGGAGIPVSAIRVRYAEPASPEKGWVVDRARPPRFDLLPDAPPAEAATPRPGGAATACAWVTVRVGPDVAAGEYSGELAVQTEGLAAVKVPMVVKVHDWKLPDPKDFSVRNNFFTSHETVARHYNAPLWSEKHMELMGREMELLGDIGCRLAVINVAENLLCMGNGEGMVKWVKQAGGGYTYDYSAVDRYLDAVAVRWGKPWMIRINIWAGTGKQRTVSVLDPATGKIEDLKDPESDKIDECVEFWKAPLAGLRERLEKRGWLDVTAFGYVSYCAPLPPPAASALMRLWPDAKGYNTSHGNFFKWEGVDKKSMPVVANEGVWGTGRLYDPDSARAAAGYPMSWKKNATYWSLSFPREGVQNIELLRESYSRLSYFRMISESCLQGNCQGIGNVGANAWPFKDERGKYTRMFNMDQLGPGSCVLAILSPGADGPAGNERYEMFREGVQTCEAIIFLQKALDSGKLGAELAGRVKTLLDDRARQYRRTCRRLWAPQSLWSFFEGSGVRERDGALFALCAEVAAAANGK
jgi:hypothetical protein